MMGKYTVMLAALAAGVCFSAGAASASTVCINAMHGSDNLGPDSSCPTTAESKVFLEKNSNTMTGFGNIGSQTGTPLMEFTSTASLDFANGFATIDGNAKPSNFPNLDITIPGHIFTDLIFDLQLAGPPTVPSGTQSLTLTAWFGSTMERTFTYTAGVLPHDSDVGFTVADAAGLTALDLSSTTGIKEVKHIEVSGVSAIPEPSTWALMLVGFAGLGYAAYRRGEKPSLGAAMA
jgi:PEP-CTERM motif